MSVTTEPTAAPTAPTVADREGLSRLICALAALGAAAPFCLAGIPGDSGAEITAVLIKDASMLQLVGIVSVLVAAALILAAVRLGALVGGGAGRLVSAAGVTVAVLFAAYNATFSAAAVVADQVLVDPGPGLGESASLVLNTVEITRFAPGLVLVVAAVAARRVLARGIWLAALVLALLTFVPLTSWLAAVLIPVWLGFAGALRTRGSEQLG